MSFISCDNIEFFCATVEDLKILIKSLFIKFSIFLTALYHLALSLFVSKSDIKILSGNKSLKSLNNIISGDAKKKILAIFSLSFSSSIKI